MYYDLYHVISIIVGVSHERMIFFGGKGGNVVSFFFLKRLRSVVTYVCTYIYIHVCVCIWRRGAREGALALFPRILYAYRYLTAHHSHFFPCTGEI